jgi:hypothetical protein
MTTRDDSKRLATVKPLGSEVAAANKPREELAHFARFGRLFLMSYKLAPYAIEKLQAALAQTAGDATEASKLMVKWARTNDKLWRALREPRERRGATASEVERLITAARVQIPAMFGDEE